MSEDALKEADGFGVIIAIGNSFVDREAKVDGVDDFGRTVFEDNGHLLSFANETEDGAGAPIG